MLWLPLTKLTLSTSAEGDPAEEKALLSSGGKDVCRRGCAGVPDAMDNVEALRRFNTGETDPSAAERFLFVMISVKPDYEGCVRGKRSGVRFG